MENTNAVISKEICFHCGETCSEPAVVYQHKPFCCAGCKTAFQILDEHGLGSYYDLESHPGINLKSGITRSRFDFLEDEEVLGRISDFKNSKRLSISLYIPNIHCTSCVWLLENLQQIEAGVLQAKVHFLKRELSLLIDTRQTSLRRVAEHLTTLGYEPEINFDKLDAAAPAPHQNRSLWLKLGVAGFAFGNIMLFSFPDYLDTGNSGLGGNFQVFFGTLNILLALPVLVYSSQDYLKSAFAAVSRGGINLDVPISIGIAALFSRSVYEIVTGTGAGYMDSFTGLIFFLLIGKLVQQKAFHRLSFNRDYRSYLPIAVNVIGSEKQEVSVSVDKLRPGSDMRLRNQELVPCDSTLLSDQAFLDYSFITGESEPVEVNRDEWVYAGAKLIGRSAMFRAEKEVQNSYLTKLWNHEAFTNNKKEIGLTSFADRISPYFTVTVLGISAIAGIYWLTVSGMEMALSVFTAVLIIACPCALALSTPFTLGSAINVLSLNGLFVKNHLLLENLAKVTGIVFDKTGTLTNKDEEAIDFEGAPLSDEQKKWIAGACMQSVHPVSRKIVEYLKEQGTADIIHPDTFFEVPGKGVFATAAGINICIGSAAFLQEQAHIAKSGIPKPDEIGTVTHVSVNGHYAGYFKIRANLRPGVKELLVALAKEFRTYLISGDNDSQKGDFTDVFNGDKETLLFNKAPEEKLEFIETLQADTQKILMIGDGLNDAGALKQSDFGIALSDDISSFSPACDAILEGAALKDLKRFIAFARTSMNIIKASFVLSLMYNTIGLGFAITGYLSPLVAAILMPLSSVSVMVFTFLTTRYKAQKLGLAIWK